jgi:uncharacterized membrane protein YheB (UPF0754 family)
MNYGLLLIPLLTAFTGWFVIRLVLWAIFHPREPKKILGLTLQGVFPAQQENLAIQAGKFASTAFSFDDLEKKISDPKNFDNVKPIIESHIDDFLRNKLKEQMPMISMFIGDKTIQSLKTVFIQEIENLFPQVMQQFGGNLKKELNIEELVSSKIRTISPARLEEQISGNLSKQFNRVSLVGGLIGLFIGLIQLAIIFLLN